MRTVTFGYAGKWSNNYGAVQQAANLVKSDATPVGVEGFQGNPVLPPIYRVVTNQEYLQPQAGHIIWTALG
jgi:hypothetical protein